MAKSHFHFVLYLLVILFSRSLAGNSLWSNHSIKLSSIETFDFNDGMRIWSLPKYRANLADTSVSGFSSGSYFASQFHVSYSSFIRGAGLIAGGPYSCVRRNPLLLNCMADSRLFPLSMNLIYNYVQAVNGKLIDDVSNLANDKQKVYILAQEPDHLVSRNVVAKQYQFYRSYVSPSNIAFTTISNAHSFPTDFDLRGNSRCHHFEKPYIANCQFDAAGNILKHIYGALNPRNMGTLNGQWVKFNQTELHPTPKKIGLGKYGYLYVPKACSDLELCRLHIVFHGCRQAVEFNSYGLPFLKNTGFINWADTNNIILAFPQTDRVWVTPLPARHPVHMGKILSCWDFMSMYDGDFDNQRGVQIQAIRKLIYIYAYWSVILKIS